MLELEIRLDGDGAFADVTQPVRQGALFRIATLDRGMESGLPSVMLGVMTEDGEVVLAETSVRLFQLAAAAITGKYGDLTGTKATVTLE